MKKPTENLDYLNLPDCRTRAVQMAEGVIVTRADYLFTANECGKCHSAALSTDDPQDILFWDAPNFGYPHLVQLTVPQMRCLNCGATPLPDWLDSKHMISERLARFIMRRVAAMETFKQIARDTGVSDTLVSDVFMEGFAEWDGKRRFDLPVRLGIDEVKTRGKYITVLVDATRTKARVIDVLQDKKKPTVSRRLAQAPNATAVQVVSMDCCDEFRDAVREMLPNAKIVVDRFHVSKKIEECFDEVRLDVWRGLSEYYLNKKMEDLERSGRGLDPSEVKKKAMKAAEKPATKDRERLKRERYVLFERASTLLKSAEKTMKRDLWLNAHPLLKEGYELKESGLAFLDDEKTPEQASAEFDRWRASFSEIMASYFGPAVKYIKPWREEIFRYRKAKDTNAISEVKNFTVHLLNTMGRGYGFEVLRARLLWADHCKPKHWKDGRRGSGMTIRKLALLAFKPR